MLTGIRVKATELASAANKLGPGDAISTPETVVGVLVKPFSTELLAVFPSASLSLLMAVTAVAKVIGLLLLSVKPVALPASCIRNIDVHVGTSCIEQIVAGIPSSQAEHTRITWYN